ncbi:phage tail spike protein, partial [Pseudolactococcus yaeyamensis]
MLISIHDKALRRMAYMDNGVPKALHYFDDSWHRYLAEATSTFDFTIAKMGHESAQYLNEENFVSFKYKGKQYLFSIMRTEEDENFIKVCTENLNLELLNETKAPIDVTTAHDLVWYLNNDSILSFAGLTIGINEVSNVTRKIKLESEQTALARLLSFSHQFDAEVEFETRLNSDGTLKSLVVNFYKKYDGEAQGVGTNRQDITLYYGKNIENVTRTVDKTGIYNVITPIGKDNLRITALDKTELDEDGNVEYYTKAGNGNIYAPQSMAKYPSQLLNNSDGWIRRYYTADGTTNVNTLYTLALNELKKNAYPSVTYEVTGFFELNIGDTVKIQDEAFNPLLILKARVSEQVISFTNPTTNKTIFGNFKALENQLSSDLQGRLAALVEAAAPYRFEIVSSDGLIFKNSAGSTTLTARVYKGSSITETVVDSFNWTIGGVVFGTSSASQVVSTDDIDSKAVVRYEAIINDMVIGGTEVTIADVSDGISGTDGRGVAKVEQKWLVQSSSTKPTYTWTDAKWQTSLPAMTATNKYLYTIERTTYTDATTSDVITLSAVYGDNGAKGDTGATGSAGSKGDKGEPTGIIKSATEPANKFVNMIWYVNSDTDVANASMEIGTVAQSHGTYTWTGSKWSLYKLRSVNMEMDNGFITNAMIANAAIDNAKIANLNANKITAGELLTSRLRPASVNLLRNTEFLEFSNGDVTGWQKRFNSGNPNTNKNTLYYSTANVYGHISLGFAQVADTSPWGDNDWGEMYQEVKAVANTGYVAHVMIRSNTTTKDNAKFSLRVECLNSSGAVISAPTIATAANAPGIINGSQVLSDGYFGNRACLASTSNTAWNTVTGTGEYNLKDTTWRQLAVSFTTPASTTKVRYILHYQGNGNFYASMPMLVNGSAYYEYVPNSLIVDGDIIVKGSIKAEHMTVNSLSAITANLGDMAAGTAKLMDNMSISTTATKKFGLFL